MIKYVAVAFIGGLVGVFFCNWHYFDFDKNFKWADLLTVGVTSFIGLYIAEKLTEKQTASRSEKDFLIGEIKEFKTELLKLKAKNDDGQIQFQDAVTLFRDLNHDIIHLTELSQFSTSCKKVSFQDLKSEFSNIRNLVTGISPTNGVIIISTDTKNLVDTSIDNVKKHLYKLILNINNAKA